MKMYDNIHKTIKNGELEKAQGLLREIDKRMAKK